MTRSPHLRLIFLARHGETAWSISGQHTGLTDLPLTPRGEANARQLRAPLEATPFAAVFSSPLQRAVRTCELAGFGDAAVINKDLAEWNYGEYEGKTTLEIRRARPDWEIFRDGCPGGESPANVAARADRVIAAMRGIDGNALLFSHGHFLRIFATRWLGLDPTAARHFLLGTAALSIVGYEHDSPYPVILLWNDCRYAGD